MDTEKIAISTSQGLLKITLDILNAPPAIQIEATAGDIKLSAPLGTIKLEGLNVDIQSTIATDVKSQGFTTVQGTMVKIN